MKMDIQGTVTIDLATYELLKSDSEKWENALRIADDIKDLRDRINRSEMNKKDICNELYSTENKLRRGY
jgi:Tfp pilus assembly ATPase PilU